MGCLHVYAWVGVLGLGLGSRWVAGWPAGRWNLTAERWLLAQLLGVGPQAPPGHLNQHFGGGLEIWGFSCSSGDSDPAF